MLLLARDDLEATFGIEHEVVVVQVTGTARDAIARRVVLVLRREAEVRDRPARAADAVMEARIDARARVHVVGIVETEPAVRRQRREARMAWPRVLEERQQSVLREP